MLHRKTSGFATCLIIAIVSFFIIFLFFPDTADRFLGVSLKHGASEIKRDLKDSVEVDKTGIVDKVVDSIDIDDLISR